ncbi:MAG: ATP-binding protein [Ilumatobacteraceae bacterium]
MTASQGRAQDSAEAMNQSSSEPSDLFRCDYAGDLRTLQRARRDVVGWLADHAADETTKERAALIVSELASNAVQASPGSSYRIEVSEVDSHLVSISVRNRPIEQLPPPREKWRPVGNLSLKEMSLRGRGLAIVDSLSEEVTIEYLDEELTVTAVLRTEREAAGA